MIPPMTNISTQSTPCRGRTVDKEEWRAPVKMQNDMIGSSNFKRSATMTGIVKGQRRDVQKTKTHVSSISLYPVIVVIYINNKTNTFQKKVNFPTTSLQTKKSVNLVASKNYVNQNKSFLTLIWSIKKHDMHAYKINTGKI